MKQTSCSILTVSSLAELGIKRVGHVKVTQAVEF